MVGNVVTDPMTMIIQKLSKALKIKCTGVLFIMNS